MFATKNKHHSGDEKCFKCIKIFHYSNPTLQPRKGFLTPGVLPGLNMAAGHTGIISRRVRVTSWYFLNKESTIIWPKFSFLFSWRYA